MISLSPSSLQLFWSTVKWKIENDNIDKSKEIRNDKDGAATNTIQTRADADFDGNNGDDGNENKNENGQRKSSPSPPSNIVNGWLYKTLVQTFQILSSYSIFNAVVMLCYCNNNRNICSFYTWFPYDVCSKCGKNIEFFAQLDECEYDKTTNNSLFHYAKANKLYFNTNRTENCDYVPKNVRQMRQQQFQRRQRKYK